MSPPGQARRGTQVEPPSARAGMGLGSPARVEPSLASAAGGSRWQFERLGYFCVDSKDTRPDALVFNRTVTLRDTWKKIQKQQKDK